MMKWIDVNEELPKTTEWVLVFGDGAMATRAYNHITKQFEDWENCRTAGLFMGDITHWMHLPHRPPDPSRPKRVRPGWGRKPYNRVWEVNTLD